MPLCPPSHALRSDKFILEFQIEGLDIEFCITLQRSRIRVSMSTRINCPKITDSVDKLKNKNTLYMPNSQAFDIDDIQSISNDIMGEG